MVIDYRRVSLNDQMDGGLPDLSSIRLPRAILFDMDGTLTIPMLDFAAIKAEMGIGSRPILEALAEMSDADRLNASNILQRHEDHAADHAMLNPGCHDLLEWIAERQIATAIVTRNSRRSTDRVMLNHRLPFSVLITRDDAVYKPSPEPLRLACERVGVSSEMSWMVGDGWHDIAAANAAGMRSVWISHRQMRSFDDVPTHEVIDLVELLELLQRLAKNG